MILDEYVVELINLCKEKLPPKTRFKLFCANYYYNYKTFYIYFEGDLNIDSYTSEKILSSYSRRKVFKKFKYKDELLELYCYRYYDLNQFGHVSGAIEFYDGYSN